MFHIILVDELEPDDEFHVVRFQQMAKEAMEKIYAAGHIPIVVGGTGFYIQALLYDIDFTDNDNDTSLRAELESICRRTWRRGTCMKNFAKWTQNRQILSMQII